MTGSNVGMRWMGNSTVFDGVGVVAEALVLRLLALAIGTDTVKGHQSTARAEDGEPVSKGVGRVDQGPQDIAVGDDILAG